jgi:hypothetical protein
VLFDGYVHAFVSFNQTLLLNWRSLCDPVTGGGGAMDGLMFVTALLVTGYICETNGHECHFTWRFIYSCSQTKMLTYSCYY